MTWFDYENQAYVVAGRYVRCGHPETMACGCYGREHEGEKAPDPPRRRDEVAGSLLHQLLRKA